MAVQLVLIARLELVVVEKMERMTWLGIWSFPHCCTSECEFGQTSCAPCQVTISEQMAVSLDAGQS